MPNLILLEDDAEFASEIGEFLRSHGCAVSWFAEPEPFMAALESDNIDIAIIDQFLGRTDMLQQVGRIREIFAGGLIMLTGNRDEVDRVLALELGTDDFVAKTVPPREVLARIRALDRRIHAAGSIGPAAPAQREAAPQGGGWQIDRRTLRLWAPGNQLVALTPAEFAALTLMIDRFGSVVSREDLSETALNRPLDPLDRSVDNLVSRVRRALAPQFDGQSVVRSVRHRGYMLTAPEVAGAAAASGP